MGYTLGERNEIMRRQKFFRGHRVKIADKLPEEMSHFEAGCEAIIRSSYSDEYGGDNVEDYGLLLLTENPHHVWWYEEDQLTLVDSDRDAGEELLQQYKGK